MWARAKSAAGRLLRGMLGWASLLAIPLGIVIGLAGSMTIGALLVLGGTLAYFLVDPILMMLDLIPGGERRRGRRPD